MRQRKQLNTQDTVLIAMFAALIAVLGIMPPISIGIIPVPITLQTLGVMLAGALIGPIRAMLASLIIVVLVCAGLPILAGGNGGLHIFFGPTGGYVIGWTPGALIIGVLVKYWGIKIKNIYARYAAIFLAAAIGGILGIYALGVPWTSIVTGLPLKTSILGSLIFLPGDLVKVLLTSIITVTVQRHYKKLWD